MWANRDPTQQRGQPIEGISERRPARQPSTFTSAGRVVCTQIVAVVVPTCRSMGPNNN
jgi:hypothetical protein